MLASITMFSDITEVISIGIPAITIAIFLLMFSEFTEVKVNWRIRKYSIAAGFCFFTLSIFQIIGSSLPILVFHLAPYLEDTSGFLNVIELFSAFALVSFLVSVGFLFLLLLELIRRFSG